MFLNHFLLADQKNFVHRSQHCNLLFLRLEDNISCDYLNHSHFQTLKRNAYLLLEKLDQLNNLNLNFSDQFNIRLIS